MDDREYSVEWRPPTNEDNQAFALISHLSSQEPLQSHAQ